MNKIGEVKLGKYKIPVFTSPYVDKNHIYLLNPNMVKVMTEMNDFEPYTFKAKVKDYFKKLWKAIKGRA